MGDPKAADVQGEDRAAARRLARDRWKVASRHFISGTSWSPAPLKMADVVVNEQKLARFEKTIRDAVKRFQRARDSQIPTQCENLRTVLQRYQDVPFIPAYNFMLTELNKYFLRPDKTTAGCVSIGAVAQYIVETWMPQGDIFIRNYMPSLVRLLQSGLTSLAVESVQLPFLVLVGRLVQSLPKDAVLPYVDVLLHSLIAMDASFGNLSDILSGVMQELAANITDGRLYISAVRCLYLPNRKVKLWAIRYLGEHWDEIMEIERRDHPEKFAKRARGVHSVREAGELPFPGIDAPIEGQRARLLALEVDADAPTTLPGDAAQFGNGLCLALDENDWVIRLAVCQLLSLKVPPELLPEETVVELLKRVLVLISECEPESVKNGKTGEEKGKGNADDLEDGAGEAEKSQVQLQMESIYDLSVSYVAYCLRFHYDAFHRTLRILISEDEENCGLKMYAALLRVREIGGFVVPETFGTLLQALSAHKDTTVLDPPVPGLLLSIKANYTSFFYHPLLVAIKSSDINEVRTGLAQLYVLVRHLPVYLLVPPELVSASLSHSVSLGLLAFLNELRKLVRDLTDGPNNVDREANGRVFQAWGDAIGVYLAAKYEQRSPVPTIVKVLLCKLLTEIREHNPTTPTPHWVSAIVRWAAAEQEDCARDWKKLLDVYNVDSGAREPGEVDGEEDSDGLDDDPEDVLGILEGSAVHEFLMRREAVGREAPLDVQSNAVVCLDAVGARLGETELRQLAPVCWRLFGSPLERVMLAAAHVFILAGHHARDVVKNIICSEFYSSVPRVRVQALKNFSALWTIRGHLSLVYRILFPSESEPLVDAEGFILGYPSDPNMPRPDSQEGAGNLNSPDMVHEMMGVFLEAVDEDEALEVEAELPEDELAEIEGENPDGHHAFTEDDVTDRMTIISVKADPWQFRKLPTVVKSDRDWARKIFDARRWLAKSQRTQALDEERVKREETEIANAPQDLENAGGFKKVAAIRGRDLGVVAHPLPPVLGVSAFPLIDLCLDEHAEVYCLARELLLHCVSTEPELFLSSFFTNLPEKYISKQKELLMRLHLLHLSIPSLHPRYAFIMFNFLFQLLKQAISQGPQHRALELMASLVPILTTLLPHVPGMDFGNLVEADGIAKAEQKAQQVEGAFARLQKEIADESEVDIARATGGDEDSSSKLTPLSLLDFDIRGVSDAATVIGSRDPSLTAEEAGAFVENQLKRGVSPTQGLQGSQLISFVNTVRAELLTTLLDRQSGVNKVPGSIIVKGLIAVVKASSEYLLPYIKRRGLSDKAVADETWAAYSPAGQSRNGRLVWVLFLHALCIHLPPEYMDSSSGQQAVTTATEGVKPKRRGLLARFGSRKQLPGPHDALTASQRQLGHSGSGAMSRHVFSSSQLAGSGSQVGLTASPSVAAIPFVQQGRKSTARLRKQWDIQQEKKLHTASAVALLQEKARADEISADSLGQQELGVVFLISALNSVLDECVRQSESVEGQPWHPIDALTIQSTFAIYTDLMERLPTFFQTSGGFELVLPTLFRFYHSQLVQVHESVKESPLTSSSHVFARTCEYIFFRIFVMHKEALLFCLVDSLSPLSNALVRGKGDVEGAWPPSRSLFRLLHCLSDPKPLLRASSPLAAANVGTIPHVTFLIVNPESPHLYRDDSAYSISQIVSLLVQMILQDFGSDRSTRMISLLRCLLPYLDAQAKSGQEGDQWLSIVIGMLGAFTPQSRRRKRLDLSLLSWDGLHEVLRIFIFMLKNHTAIHHEHSRTVNYALDTMLSHTATREQQRNAAAPSGMPGVPALPVVEPGQDKSTVVALSEERQLKEDAEGDVLRVGRVSALPSKRDDLNDSLLWLYEYIVDGWLPLTQREDFTQDLLVPFLDLIPILSRALVVSIRDESMMSTIASIIRTLPPPLFQKAAPIIKAHAGVNIFGALRDPLVSRLARAAAADIVCDIMVCVAEPISEPINVNYTVEASQDPTAARPDVQEYLDVLRDVIVPITVRYGRHGKFLEGTTGSVFGSRTIHWRWLMTMVQPFIFSFDSERFDAGLLALRYLLVRGARELDDYYPWLANFIVVCLESPAHRTLPSVLAFVEFLLRTRSPLGAHLLSVIRQKIPVLHALEDTEAQEAAARLEKLVTSDARSPPATELYRELDLELVTLLQAAQCDLE